MHHGGVLLFSLLLWSAWSWGIGFGFGKGRLLLRLEISSGFEDIGRFISDTQLGMEYGYGSVGPFHCFHQLFLYVRSCTLRIIANTKVLHTRIHTQIYHHPF
jgi:hypothetical protein